MKRAVISLFTGAGGLDLGFEAAGFETAVAVEMDDRCVDTIRHNRNWKVLHSDVHSVSSSDLLETAGLKKGEASILIGGPPCQPFSKSGFWATGESKRLADPRATTLDEYLRILEDTLPEAFLIENVAGIAYKGKSEGLEYILNRIKEINVRQQSNYQVETMRINAAHFGVPQLRERMLLVGHREGKKFGELLSTHGDQLFVKPFTNTWDAIGHLENDGSKELKLKGKWAGLLSSIPEGENYLYHTDRGAGLPLFGWRRRFWNFLLKIAKDKPSWTITAQPGPATGPFHWNNRHLSPQEMAAIQTFPANYKILGTRAEAQKQIGNAVPSALAEAIALKIRSRYFEETEYENKEATLIPEKRSDCPKKKRLTKVGKEYLELAGDHSAHPGTGKGYGALKIKQQS